MRQFYKGNEPQCKTCENRDNNRNGMYCMVVNPEIKAGFCRTYQREQDERRDSKC